MTIKQYVFYVLENYPESRSNDEVLVNLVFHEYAQDHSLSVLMVNDTVKGLGLLPSIRSIIRQRQRIQAKHPELTDKKAVAERAALEEEYREEYLSDTDSDLLSNLTLDIEALDIDSLVEDSELDFPELVIDPDQLTF